MRPLYNHGLDLGVPLGESLWAMTIPDRCSINYRKDTSYRICVSIVPCKRYECT